MSGFRVHFDVFEGPLDLLLYLVRSREVDVLEIALASVAEKYLEMIEALAAINIEEVGDFLIVASNLMEIKSRQLLPAVEEVEEPEEEGVREELVRQLLEYKRFKEAGSLLWQRAQVQQQKLPRRADDLATPAVEPSSQPIRELELWDLVSAFSRLMRENIVPISQGIARDPTPITVYMERLEKMVLDGGGMLFRDLIGLRNTRSQIIGKFLALLELIKSKRVWVEMVEGTYDILVAPPRPEQTQSLPPVEESMPMTDPEAPPEAANGASRPSSINNGAGADGNDEESDEDLDGMEDLDFDESLLMRVEQMPSVPRSAWDDFEPLVDTTDLEHQDVDAENTHDEVLPPNGDLDSDDSLPHESPDGP